MARGLSVDEGDLGDCLRQILDPWQDEEDCSSGEVD